MSAALRSELLKLRTTRTFAALVGSALALSLLTVTLSAALNDEFTTGDVRELFTADFTSLFIMLLGVMGMAGEWRHRTITSTVLAQPDRVRLVAAKALAYAIAGALLSLVVTVSIMAVGTAILSGRELETLSVADMADVLWRNLLVAALAAVVGVCVGGIVRNQVVAIVGLLVFSFALEPTLVALVPDVGKFGPTAGAPTGILGTSGVGDDEELLGTGAAVLVMLGWVTAGFVATAVSLRTRDLV
jgi:hypothetical protein